MLQLQDVKKTYKTKAGDVHALDGVSLTFPEKGLVFITGKSGCGKTTLLNVIGGLDGIDAGEILIQDKKFSEFSASEYDSYRNTFIGFIFQEYNILPEFTVEKNIKMAMELQGAKADDETFNKLLADMDIKDLKSRKPSELSGGQRQRVAIARALVKQPRIIMADEPTGALDSNTGVQVLDTLKKLSESRLVIVVSHDREFAEKYADRIIHLEDGRVVQDVTFSEKELDGNVCEQGETFFVREGSDLTDKEKNELAEAIKVRKKVEIIENPRFRDKKDTGEVTLRESKAISFRKSKMKLKSAAQLGMKSLVVKPVRLVFTIIISALAFAIFGIFDTVANFSTAKVLENQLSITPSKTMVATTDYIVNDGTDDRYTVRVSQDTVAALQKKTGGKVKGITDLEVKYEKWGVISDAQSITELNGSVMAKGKRYYTKSVNGFVEFDKNKEISAKGKFKDFGYKIIEGEYPELVDENNDGEIDEESVYSVGISTFVADSIIHYLNGKPLTDGGEPIDDYKDFIGEIITVDNRMYTIACVIDCGKIPKKYATLGERNYYTDETAALESDFNAFINSGAQKCLFVGDGFVEYVKAENGVLNTYSIGDQAEWRLSVGTETATKLTEEYVYDVADFDKDNIILFGDENSAEQKVALKDDEVLLHVLNIERLFESQLRLLNSTEKSRVKDLIDRLQEPVPEDILIEKTPKEYYYETFGELITTMKVSLEEVPTVTIHRRFDGGETKTKTLTVKGIYFRVDGDNANSYKLMMNKNLMRELEVFSQQGAYSKLLFSSRSIDRGGDVIVDYLLSDSALVFTWYENSALSMIRENETALRQFANLFLYADILLSVLAIFMLYSYISTSISRKKQSVGILRALGAGKKDILRTFLFESLAVALINGILANGLAVVGCMLVNKYIVEIMNVSVHFALFGIRQILMISGVSLLTAIVSSSLPIVKIAKKKPVELIRRP